MWATSTLVCVSNETQLPKLYFILLSRSLLTHSLPFVELFHMRFPHYGPGVDSPSNRNTRNIPGGEGQPARNAHKPTAIFEPIV
jgi:hypothetical protein